MKIIITESQNKHLNLNLHLYRRLPDIERELNNLLKDSEDWDIELGFENFLHNIGVSVGIRIADMYDSPERSEDEYITFRNQVIRFVKTEFYDQIKQMYLRYTT
jgi:ferredoxin-fold anticodon binding domain-containing protein